MSSLTARSVRICGIDEIDTQLDSTAHDGHAFGPVDRLTPDTGSGQPHRAEPEPMHGPLANSERSGRVGGKRGRHGTVLPLRYSRVAVSPEARHARLMSLISPPALRAGDTVAIVSLSAGVSAAVPHRHDAGMRQLEQTFDVQVVDAPNARRDDAFLRANPAGASR